MLFPTRYSSHVCKISLRSEVREHGSLRNVTCNYQTKKQRARLVLVIKSKIDNRREKNSSNLSPSGRIRQVQNTTSCHNFGTINLSSIRISTVRGHAPYKYPLRNTMPKSSGTNATPLPISGATLPFPLRLKKKIYIYILKKQICIYIYIYRK